MWVSSCTVRLPPCTELALPLRALPLCHVQRWYVPPERAAQALSGLWTWLTQQAKPVFGTVSRGPVIQLCRLTLSQASVPGGTRLDVHVHPRLCPLSVRWRDAVMSVTWHFTAPWLFPPLSLIADSYKQRKPKTEIA